MFIELKVVCIDLHAGLNEGHYGHLTVLQMHQRGLTSWVFPLWTTCCILLLLPKFWWAELPCSLTSHSQSECSTTKHCLTQTTQISPYLRKRSVESRGGSTSFPDISVHDIARSNSVILCALCQTIQLFLKDSWVQNSEAIHSPEIDALPAPRFFTLSCLQAQTTRVPFSSATNIANTGHTVSKGFAFCPWGDRMTDYKWTCKIQGFF